MLSPSGHRPRHLTAGEAGLLWGPALLVAGGVCMVWWLFYGPGLMVLHPQIHRLAASTLHDASCAMSISERLKDQGYVSLAYLSATAAGAGVARSCATAASAPAREPR